MRPAVPDLHIGLPLLLLWIVILLLVVVGHLLYRRWRRSQPKPAPRETSYTKTLRQRLAARQHGGKSPDQGAISRGTRPKARRRR